MYVKHVHPIHSSTNGLFDHIQNGVKLHLFWWGADLTRTLFCGNKQLYISHATITLFPTKRHTNYLMSFSCSPIIWALKKLPCNKLGSSPRRTQLILNPQKFCWKKCGREPSISCKKNSPIFHCFRFTIRCAKRSPQPMSQDRIDCKVACCWGCNKAHVEARAGAGMLCWICLRILTILVIVSLVARSAPPLITYQDLYIKSSISVKHKMIPEK